MRRGCQAAVLCCVVLLPATDGDTERVELLLWLKHWPHAAGSVRTPGTNHTHTQQLHQQTGHSRGCRYWPDDVTMAVALAGPPTYICRFHTLITTLAGRSNNKFAPCEMWRSRVSYPAGTCPAGIHIWQLLTWDLHYLPGILCLPVLTSVKPDNTPLSPP